jgi:hypothetical protein
MPFRGHEDVEPLESWGINKDRFGQLIADGAVFLAWRNFKGQVPIIHFLRVKEFYGQFIN